MMHARGKNRKKHLYSGFMTVILMKFWPYAQFIAQGQHNSAQFLAAESQKTCNG